MGRHSGEETEGHAASLLSGAPFLDVRDQYSSAEEEDSGSQNCHPRTMGRGSCKAGDVTSTVSQSAVEVIPVQIFVLDLKICPPRGFLGGQRHYQVLLLVEKLVYSLDDMLSAGSVVPQLASRGQKASQLPST